MSLLRGVLLAGRFRTQHQLNRMSDEDQRNTLIVELTGRSNQNNFQALNNDALVEAGVVLVFLRTARIRNDAQLKTMSIDDMRNILIVEIGAMTGMGRELQGLSNLELVLIGLGNRPGSLNQSTFVRGVLLAGKIRTQHELNKTTDEDQRNTLIVELAGRSNQSNFQKFNDFTLAGMGAVLFFLRDSGIRNDAQLRTISMDEMRNIMIVEIGAQTGKGSELQGLINMDLVRLGLGVDPSKVFILPKPPIQQPTLPYVFSISNFEIHNQKADSDHSDNDFLSIVVTTVNPFTKSAKTFPGKTIHLGDGIKTGTIVNGPFLSDPIEPDPDDIVIINYIVTNFGSSKAEEQFAQAVQVTNKVVSIVGPVAGALAGLFFWGDPESGLKIGEQVAKGFDTAIDTLSDIFDFFDLHAGPPNCNGEVLRDTLTYQPIELHQALNMPASKEISGPRENDRCSVPHTKVNFSIQNV
jgi:hypothetical protein